ncbi:putative entry exclusion protein TrbK-alt [Aureimonas populi]|uniref:Entry exclusion protein TrbK-alt n=1 Tax=Aureimonas populi TaxID=1701758 RepID=A0ABW5CHF6_9HYPH|nr:putative entry exclusion protein TrbK-alt [Aureimonas populi]
MEGKMFARIGAAVFVAVAITATAIELTRNEEAPERWPSGRVTQERVDPLRDALIRCQSLGEAGPRDPECRRAWAENRHRFLAPGARPMERLPEPPPPNAGLQESPDDPVRRESAPQLEEVR